MYSKHKNNKNKKKMFMQESRNINFSYVSPYVRV